MGRAETAERLSSGWFVVAWMIGSSSRVFADYDGADHRPLFAKPIGRLHRRSRKTSTRKLGNIGLGGLTEEVPGAATVGAANLWNLEPRGVVGVVQLGGEFEVAAVAVGQGFASFCATARTLATVPGCCPESRRWPAMPRGAAGRGACRGWLLRSTTETGSVSW